MEDQDVRSVTGTDASDNEPSLVVSPADATGTVSLATTTVATEITADIKITLARVMDLLRQARESDDKSAQLPLNDPDVTLNFGTYELSDDQKDDAADLGDPLSFTVVELEDYIRDTDQIPERQQP